MSWRGSAGGVSNFIEYFGFPLLKNQHLICVDLLLSAYRGQGVILNVEGEGRGGGGGGLTIVLIIAPNFPYPVNSRGLYPHNASCYWWHHCAQSVWFAKHLFVVVCQYWQIQNISRENINNRICKCYFHFLCCLYRPTNLFYSFLKKWQVWCLVAWDIPYPVNLTPNMYPVSL